jgi:predicted amidohydrolase
MRICGVQVAPVAGDVDANVQAHVRLIERAALSGSEFVFFPELSLTGYEPSLARELAMDSSDARLDIFQQLAEASGLTIGVGAPTRAPEGTRISMILFQPFAARVTYSKQMLHADELPFFVPGEGQLLLRTGDGAVAPAICYESLQPAHAADAALLGADVYLASVAKPARKVATAYAHYPAVAMRHRMTVVMANSVGPCDDFVAAGQSAAWNSRGELLGNLDDAHEGLLIVDTLTGALVYAHPRSQNPA